MFLDKNPGLDNSIETKNSMRTNYFTIRVQQNMYVHISNIVLPIVHIIVLVIELVVQRRTALISISATKQ